MKSNDIQKQLAKLRRDKRVLWLGILFFVLVVMWILLSIFTTSRTSSVSPQLRELAKSFVPRLESRVFEEILRKRAFDQGELQGFPIYIFDKKVGEAGLEKINVIDFITESEEEDLESSSLEELEESEESTATTSSASVLPDEQASEAGVLEN